MDTVSYKRRASIRGLGIQLLGCADLGRRWWDHGQSSTVHGQQIVVSPTATTLPENATVGAHTVEPENETTIDAGVMLKTLHIASAASACGVPVQAAPVYSVTFADAQLAAPLHPHAQLR